MRIRQLFILLACMTLILSACTPKNSHNEADDSIKNTLPDTTPPSYIITSSADIPPLNEVKNYTEDGLLEELYGVHQDTLTAVWGKAAGMLSGLYGDIWYYDLEDRYKQLIVYYDPNTMLVEHVHFSEMPNSLRDPQAPTYIPVSADVLDKENIPETSCLVVPDYVPLSEIPDNYTFEDAKKDGCVAFEGTSLVSGGDVWNGFLYAIRDGKAETVRIAKYYPDDNSMYLSDLTYNGVSYMITTDEGSVSEYKYLNHYIEDVTTNSAYSAAEYYILTNDKYVTYKQLELSLVSSSSLNWIEHHRVYTNFIKAE